MPEKKVEIHGTPVPKGIEILGGKPSRMQDPQIVGAEPVGGNSNTRILDKSMPVKDQPADIHVHQDRSSYKKALKDANL